MSFTARCAACSNVSSGVGIAEGNVHRDPDLLPSASDLIPRKTLVFSCRSRVLTFPVASASVSRGAGVNGSPACVVHRYITHVMGVLLVIAIPLLHIKYTSCTHTITKTYQSTLHHWVQYDPRHYPWHT